jgi:hypothetical protein
VLQDAGLLTVEETDLLAPDTGAAGAMVDEVIARARALRAQESQSWP